MVTIFRRRRPKRRALRQFASADDLRQQWRQLIAAPASGDYRPAAPVGVPAYAEELRGFAAPDWSFIHEYPYEVGELAPTGWGGEATLRPWQVTR